MIYDGKDLSRIVRANVSKSILPEVSMDSVEVPGRPGQAFAGVRLGMRELTVAMRLRLMPDGDVPAAHRELAAALYKDSPRKLVLPDDPGRYYMAVMTGPSDLDNLWYTGGAEVTFTCPDPIIYGAERRCELPGTARVGGTFETYPTVTARPAKGSSWRVTNRSTGEYVELVYDFKGTEEVTVDTEGMHCEIDGTGADRYVSVYSDFFALAPGKVEVTLSSGTGEMRWDEKWL